MQINKVIAVQIGNIFDYENLFEVSSYPTMSERNLSEDLSATSSEISLAHCNSAGLIGQEKKSRTLFVTRCGSGNILKPKQTEIIKTKRTLNKYENKQMIFGQLKYLQKLENLSAIEKKVNYINRRKEILDYNFRSKIVSSPYILTKIQEQLEDLKKDIEPKKLSEIIGFAAEIENGLFTFNLEGIDTILKIILENITKLTGKLHMLNSESKGKYYTPYFEKLITKIIDLKEDMMCPDHQKHLSNWSMYFENIKKLMPSKTRKNNINVLVSDYISTTQLGISPLAIMLRDEERKNSVPMVMSVMAQRITGAGITLKQLINLDGSPRIKNTDRLRKGLVDSNEAISPVISPDGTNLTKLLDQFFNLFRKDYAPAINLKKLLQNGSPGNCLEGIKQEIANNYSLNDLTLSFTSFFKDAQVADSFITHEVLKQIADMTNHKKAMTYAFEMITPTSRDLYEVQIEKRILMLILDTISTYLVQLNEILSAYPEFENEHGRNAQNTAKGLCFTLGERACNKVNQVVSERNNQELLVRALSIFIDAFLHQKIIKDQDGVFAIRSLSKSYILYVLEKNPNNKLYRDELNRR